MNTLRVCVYLYACTTTTTTSIIITAQFYRMIFFFFSSTIFIRPIVLFLSLVCTVRVLYNNRRRRRCVVGASIDYFYRPSVRRVILVDSVVCISYTVYNDWFMFIRIYTITVFFGCHVVVRFIYRVRFKHQPTCYRVEYSYARSSNALSCFFVFKVDSNISELLLMSIEHFREYRLYETPYRIRAAVTTTTSSSLTTDGKPTMISIVFKCPKLV